MITLTGIYDSISAEKVMINILTNYIIHLGFLMGALTLLPLI